MDWMKAQASTGSGVCVEVARTVDGRVAMRHSKNLDGPVLKFSSDSAYSSWKPSGIMNLRT